MGNMRLTFTPDGTPNHYDMLVVYLNNTKDTLRVDC